jgi:hypothetical protein
VNGGCAHQRWLERSPISACPHGARAAIRRASQPEVAHRAMHSLDGRGTVGVVARRWVETRPAIEGEGSGARFVEALFASGLLLVLACCRGLVDSVATNGRSFPSHASLSTAESAGSGSSGPSAWGGAHHLRLRPGAAGNVTRARRPLRRAKSGISLVSLSQQEWRVTEHQSTRTRPARTIGR